MAVAKQSIYFAWPNIWCTYRSCEQCEHVGQFFRKLGEFEDVLPNLQHVCVPNFLWRVDPTTHRNHTRYLGAPHVHFEVVLDHSECIVSWIVGEDSTIDIVVTLSEVDRSCRGVASNLPDWNCVCVLCVCLRETERKRSKFNVH